LLKVLAPFGFDVIDPGELSFREQVELFSQASVVIAPHGAALANLVFCRPATRILEIFSPRYVSICYWPLACINNLAYYYLIGSGRVPASGNEPLAVYDDIRIDPETVKPLVDRFLS
jgi:capsular polysaccharide biosynthesis protein